MTVLSTVDASSAPILTHLVELRRRLLLCFAAFLLVFGVAYYFSEHIYAFLTRPLTLAFGDEAGRRMIYTGLHEAFFTYLKLAMFAAACICIPFALNQLWKFLAPGLYAHERHALRPAFIATPLLFAAGAALAFYVVFPLAFGFFLSFETRGVAGAVPIELEARVGEYLSLITRLILAFGLAFELPVVLLVLARVGVVSAVGLRAYRKHAIVAVFVVAAIITPPDLISQVALGIPVLLLYELSILAVDWSSADRETKFRDEVRRKGAGRSS